jgi:hypothetical protein
MKNMRVRVEVEPLSDARVAKVRQQVFARIEAESRARPTLLLERGRRGPSAVALLSFAAAAVVAALVTRAWIGRAMPDNLRLATTESASQFTIGESALDVAPRSALLVRGDDPHGIDVVLDRGAVTCEVAPRRGRPPFVVDAGEVRVRVVGTRFTVVREGDGAKVSVDHGVVEVTSRGATVVLHDGERWPREVESAGAAPSAASVSAVPSVPPTPVVSAPAVLGGHAPHSHGWRHAPPSARDPKPAPEAVDPSPSPPSAVVVAPPPPAAPAPRDVFESAARLEATNPDRAAELYRQLAGGGSSWAPNALYAVARLDADRGNRAEAKVLLRDYLARYPRGQNAQDARDLLGRMP